MATPKPPKVPGKFGPALGTALAEMSEHPLSPNKAAPAEAVPVFPAAKATGLAAVAEEAALSGRQLSRRFPNFVERVRTMQRQVAVARMPRSRIYAFGRFVSQSLGGRRLAALAAEELEQLEAQLRRKFVVDSTGLAQVLKQARARAKGMTGATARKVVTSTVDRPEGVWVFVHTDSPEPVVLMEAFAPRRPTAAIQRPPFPGGRTPRWLHDGTSTPVADPPSLPASPPRLVGPAQGLLDHAPGIILDQMMRAERHRSAGAWVAVGTKIVKYFGDVPQKLRRTLGLRIESIAVQRAAPGTVGWDTRVEIVGTTGRSPDRFPDIDVLPDPAAAFGPNSGMERLHGWGPILGDSTPAGGGYGPAGLNELQRQTIERFLQTGRNPQASVRLSTAVYLEHRPTLAGVQPFVKTVKYRWTDAGVRRSVAFGVDDTGKVFGPILEGP